MNTVLATAAATLAWIGGEALSKGKASKEEEREGLDISSHGETAYNR